MNKAYYSNQDFNLFFGDSIDILKSIKKKSIDMIFADPPYFLSNNGITCHSGKMVSVNKGSWDETKMSIEEKIKYNRKWIKASKKVLKDEGTIFISGTLHNIFVVGVALELEGFSIINNITWQKKNPPPHLARKAFTHSTETIIWAKKIDFKKYKFNYDLMKTINGGKQMKDVWTFSLTKKNEKKYGKHPTQKPIELLERIILASTNESDLILDPFNGSGTTGIAATKLNRRYIGIDIDKSYLDITVRRYKALKGLE